MHIKLSPAEAEQQNQHRIHQANQIKQLGMEEEEEEDSNAANISDVDSNRNRLLYRMEEEEEEENHHRRVVIQGGGGSDVVGDVFVEDEEKEDKKRIKEDKKRIKEDKKRIKEDIKDIEKEEQKENEDDDTIAPIRGRGRYYHSTKNIAPIRRRTDGSTNSTTAQNLNTIPMVCNSFWGSSNFTSFPLGRKQTYLLTIFFCFHDFFFFHGNN